MNIDDLKYNKQIKKVIMDVIIIAESLFRAYFLFCVMNKEGLKLFGAS